MAPHDTRPQNDAVTAPRPSSPPLRRVAGAWLVRNGRILVLQRSGGLSDGSWVPPGGLVDPGEEPLATALRETLEETGLSLGAPAFLRSWSWEAASIDVHHFVGVAEGPIVRISAEHYDFDWLTPGDYVERHLRNVTSPRFERWAEDMRVSAELVARWIEEFSRE